MALIDSLLAIRQFEDQQQQRDVQAIGQSISNFLNIRRQLEIDDLNRRNVESQIDSREKEDVFDQLQKINTGIDFARSTGDRDLFNKLSNMGKNLVSPQTTDDLLTPSGPIDGINKNLSPVAQVKESAAKQLDDFISEPDLNEIDPFTGEPTVEAELLKQKKESKIGIEKQVGAKSAKDQLTAQQDLVNVRLKARNLFDQFVDVAEKNKEQIGADPGVIGGITANIFGATRANEFVPAFRGGQIEFAAAAGRVAIPGARAVRLVNLFKKTAPTLFDTTESSAEQVAFSYRNGLSSSLSRDIEKIFPEFPNASIQEKENMLKTLDKQLDAFENEFKDSLLKSVLKEQPDLLKRETQDRLIQSMTEEELKELLNAD